MTELKNIFLLQLVMILLSCSSGGKSGVHKELTSKGGECFVDYVDGEKHGKETS